MKDKPNVLFIWNKDIRHPDAGGGTIEFFAIMKSLAAKGFDVTQVSGGFSGSKSSEKIEGVSIVRMGKLFTMPFLLWKAQLTHHFLDNFDVIVEGLGYVSLLLPFITRKPVLVVCQHLPKEIFSIEGPHVLGKPLGYVLPPIARFVESAIFPVVYKRVPIFTFSESTKEDLVETGFPRENVLLFRNALAGMTMRNDPLISGNAVPNAAILKRSTPTIVCIGRLRKYKGVQDLIKAMPKIKQEFPRVTLYIVGKGEYEPQLKRLSHSLDLDENIVFSGFVDVSEKFDLISSSNLLVMPSYREGFA
ncbi:glycosyltransferase family 4 protein, partial [Candidatus Bathyarchaeota archaeon]